MKNLKLVIKNQTIKNYNKEKIKSFKTEPNLKITNLSSISNSSKQILDNLNYKLFKYNENRKKNINILFPFNKDELFSTIIIKNFNKKISIKNLKELNTKSEQNSNNIYHSATNSFNNNSNRLRINQNIVNNNKYYFPINKNILPKMNNNNSLDKECSIINNSIKDRKINLCLVPLIHSYRYKRNKFNNIKNSIFSSIFNNKKNKNKIKNTRNNTFSKTSSSYYKIRNKTKNIINSKIIKEYKDTKEEKEEENDMEPKIRFINLKKELIQENLKINKMFFDFNKEILDKKNLIKYIGKYRIKNKSKKKNLLINNF